MKDKLASIICSGNDLNCVLWYLSVQQCIAVCEAMKDKLPTIVHSLDELAYVQQYLPDLQQSLVNDAVKKYWYSKVSSDINIKFSSQEERNLAYYFFKHVLSETFKNKPEEQTRTQDTKLLHLFASIDALNTYSVSLFVDGTTVLSDKKIKAGLIGHQLAMKLRAEIINKNVNEIDLNLFEDTLKKGFTEMSEYRRLGCFHAILSAITLAWTRFKLSVIGLMSRESKRSDVNIGSTSPGFFALTTRQKKIVEINNALKEVKSQNRV